MFRCALSITLGLLGCGSTPSDEFAPAVLARAHQADRCARPSLLRLRYTRMARASYAYMRAARSVLVARRQLAAETQPLPDLGRGLGPGDPHLENFGVMHSAGGPVVTFNDWDAAGAHNFAWSLERLALSVGLTTERYGYADEDLRRVIRQTLSGYRAGRCGQEEAPASEAVDQLLRLASESDGGLSKYTELGRLRWGVTSSGRQAVVPLPSALADHVIDQVSRHLEHSLVDIGVLLGRGISGLTRLRLLALTRDGLTLRLVEFKELIPPGDVQVKQDVLLTGDIMTQSLAVARRLWPEGVGLGWRIVEVLGQPMWLREMLPGEKGFEHDELGLHTGSPEGLAELGETLAWRLGRAHHESTSVCPPAFLSAHVEGLVNALTQQHRDHGAFKAAFTRHGLGLGAPTCESSPSAERRRLLGLDVFESEMMR
ncbi:MAG: DUF2252 family protein [Myxococcota bacterium]|nr:DUF2252 family protein [Myxococcota bacterium]